MKNQRKVRKKIGSIYCFTNEEGSIGWKKKKRPEYYKVGRILLYLAHTELIFLITSTNQYEKGEHPNRNKSREL